MYSTSPAASFAHSEHLLAIFEPFPDLRSFMRCKRAWIVMAFDGRIWSTFWMEIMRELMENVLAFSKGEIRMMGLVQKSRFSVEYFQ
jgi:hypothetical protein